MAHGGTGDDGPSTFLIPTGRCWASEILLLREPLALWSPRLRWPAFGVALAFHGVGYEYVLEDENECRKHFL